MIAAHSNSLHVFWPNAESNQFGFLSLCDHSRSSRRKLASTSELPHSDASLLAPLVQAALSSASSYHDLADTTVDAELLGFAQVMVRQRYALCRALARRNLQAWDDDSLADQDVTAIRSAWLCAMWNFDQNDTAAFVEHAEYAESLLEDAFLAAAEACEDHELATELREHAVVICGARQRWAEFAATRICQDR